MKRLGITFKLFMITGGLFLLFLCIIILGQSMFFEHLYLKKKVSNLQKEINQFALDYGANQWDQQEILEQMKQFIAENNAQIAILNKMGLAKFTPSFSINVKTKDNDTITIPVNIQNAQAIVNTIPLEVGKEITIKGVRDEIQSQVMYPYSIESKGSRLSIQGGAKLEIPDVQGSRDQQLTAEAEAGQFLEVRVYKSGDTSLKEANISDLTIMVNKGMGVEEIPSKEIQIQEVEGKIVASTIPLETGFFATYQESALWSAIDDWFWILKSIPFSPENTDLIHYQYKSPLSDTENVVMVKPLINDGGEIEMVFALTSLQPVGEALGVMKEVYFYSLLGALFIIVMMSYIYSKLIARPLITMNQAALQMAQLDFSVSCPIDSGDELGTLANSLNQLARTLKETMGSLQSTNAQLQVEIEKERGLEKMRKEFISSVSHELKTPLGIIKGFTEGLRDGVAAEKQEYYLEVIADEIEKMDALVLDMLQLTKLESKGDRLRLEAFYPYDLVEEIKHRLQPQLQEMEVQLEIIGDGAEAMVMADARKIEQVFNNFLTNALRHTGVRGKVQVILQQREETLEIAVENQGNQIPEDKLPYLWDRFFRVEESRNRASGGTGLGLAIVKNILELHQAPYGVENVPGGVRFFFSLPLVKEEWEAVTPE